MKSLPARLTILWVACVLLTACGDHPRSALDHAIARDDVAQVKAMLRPGQEFQVLTSAARWGNRNVLRALLAQGVNPNVQIGVNSWTPLMHAIHKQQPESVAVLLEGGADPNFPSGNGTTPLVMASGYGYADIVKRLLEHGAKTSAVNKDGMNALTAAMAGVADIDRFTVGHCQTETVRALLAADPKQELRPGFWSNTGLRLARLNRCEEVLKLVKAPVSAHP